MVWYRRCSGYARQRRGPKLLNCCRLEQVGTKDCGKMLKRLRILEDGRVPAKEAQRLEDGRKEEEVHQEGIKKD